MSKELVISTSRHETKLAILEDDQLVEVYFQRSNEYSLAGSIHKGRVTRVLPGMQSAFVDLGLERDTFLYVSDFFEENDEYDPIAGEDRPVKPPSRPPAIETVTVEVIAERPAPEVAPVVAEPVAAPAVVAAIAPPPAQERSEEGDRRGGGPPGGDRRGRRSRRRRKGGGGFPDSKYATDVKDEPQEEDTDSAITEEEEAPAEVMLLPGESLAKYSRSAARASAPEPKPVREARQPEPVQKPVEQIAEPAPASEVPPEILAAIPLPDRIEPPIGLPEPLPFPEIHEEPEPVAVQPEPVHVPEPEVHAIAAVSEPEPVVHHETPPVAEPEPVIHQETPAPEPEPARHHEPPASEPEPEIPPAPAHHAEAPPTHSEEEHHPVPVSFVHGLDAEAAVEHHTQTVHSDDPEAVFEAPSEHHHEAEELAEHYESATVESNEAGDDQEPMSVTDEVLELLEGVQSDEAVGEEEPTPQTSATVREQGGRFAHRGSRRMRRRNRGGGGGGEGRPEGRPEQQPRPEPAVVTPAQVVPVAPVVVERTRPDRERPPLPSITELLKEGQEIIVQIAKEPLGQKGARITSHIALPGRYVVFMPTLEHLGVSRKVSTDEERLRLKRILQTHRVGIPGGFIVRTAGEGRTEDEIASDMSFLYNLWLDIRQKAERRPAPLLLHHDLDIVQRTLRDQLTEDFKTITVDTEDLYESVLRFVQRFQPSLVGRIKLYTRPAPIFDAFNITAELEKALRPKVWLKSGGYIVINQTEALVAIDVNTGKYVGKSNRLEDTIVKTNTDAVKEIVRQIRLRDLGGIIVIDFIDMDERKNRQKVMQALEEAMRSDRAPYKILQFNDFGLVAITRKRVKQSLERTLCAPCPYCEGAGYVKSVQTIIGEILQEGHKLARVVEGKDVMLRVNPEVAKMLKSNDNKYLEELEETLGRPVLVKSDPLLHHEKFDLV